MSKKWLTANALLREGLPGISTSRHRLSRYLRSVRVWGNPYVWRPKRTVANTREGGVVPIEYHYTCLPPEAICAYEVRYPAVTASHPYDARAAWHSKGVLMTAEGGMLRAFILQQFATRRDLSASRIHALCIARFGADVTMLSQGRSVQVHMPSLHTFQQFIRNLRIIRNLRKSENL